MRKTAVMTDTNGMSMKQGEEVGVFVLPMPFVVGEKTYLEDLEIGVNDYYRMMHEGVDATTSQPSPGSFTSMWDYILESGYDEIIYIPMTSGLSGSCATATRFAEDYGGKVQVADNHRISVTQFTSVLDALRLRERGMSAAEIRRKLEERAYDQTIYITVQDLSRLIKSGRVTPAGAAIASALNLKPVLQIQGEKLDAYAKVRGMKKAEKVMIDALRDDLEGRLSGFPKNHLRVYTAGSFIEESDASVWRDQVQEAFPDYEVRYEPLSCSIATHVGANAAGIGAVYVE